MLKWLMSIMPVSRRAHAEAIAREIRAYNALSKQYHESERAHRELFERIDWCRVRKGVNQDGVYRLQIAINSEIAHHIMQGDEGAAKIMARDVAFRVEHALRDLARWERYPFEDGWRPKNP